MFKLKSRKKEKFDQSTDDYEEISEKKTSKLGYVFLILLVIFLFIVGQNVFNDIQKIPARPIPPNQTIETYLDAENLKTILYSSTYRTYEKVRFVEPEPLPPTMEEGEKLITIQMPEFTKIDNRFGIDKKFENIEPTLNTILSLNRTIKNSEQEINLKKSQLKEVLDRYDLSLQEIIAKEETLMDKPGIRAQIVLLNGEISLLERKLAEKISGRNNQINSIKVRLAELKRDLKAALEYYRDQEARYNFIVFLLKLLFVLPFFIISLRLYFKLHRKNSPNAIIAASILVASSALFMEIVIIFLYQILPTEWLERLFKILKEVVALKYVIYYFSAFLVILIFGGTVYLIQKKVFNPKRVALRRLKDNKCANCSFPIDKSYDFCPKCGKELKEKCSHCGNLRIKNLPHCPSCGKK